MRYLLLLVICLTGFSVDALAQEQNYWVVLSDKANSPYNLTAPSNFLTQRALNRRFAQEIPLDISDLPVNPSYIQAIQAIEDVEYRYASRWFNAVAVYCEPNKLNEIEALPFVSQVRNAYTMTAPPRAVLTSEPDRNIPDFQMRLPIEYGLSANQILDLNGQALHEEGFEGQGLVMAIMDSGFRDVDDMESFQHLFDDGRILSTVDFVDGDGEVYNENNHGRFVLSCIAGIKEGEAYGTATQASFHLLRTEDTGGETTAEEFNWIAAAEYADSVGVDIINTSLGYTTFDTADQSYTYADMDGNTAWITIGADIAASKGMLMVNSAGNSGANAWRYIGAPADADSVLAIGSVNADSLHTQFSSFGPTADGRVKPNVCAQGLFAIGINGDDEVVTVTGTSFSAPIVAGLAACLWQSDPDAHSMDVFEAIERSAHLHTTPNDSLGFGIPNFDLARTILEDISSGVGEYQELDFSVYPNPSNEYVWVTPAANASSRELTYRLVSLQGKVLMETKGRFKEGSTFINLSKYAEGTYILEVNTGEAKGSKVISITR